MKKVVVEAPAAEQPEVEKEQEDECEQIDLTKLNVGDKLRCWCGNGKCKDFRQHRVKGFTPGKPPHTVCLTCNAVHLARLYRPGSRKKKVAKKAAPPVNRWKELVEDVEAEATEYSLQASFVRDDFVDHSVFGKGKVLELISSKKIRVIFEGGTKVLLHNR